MGKTRLEELCYELYGSSKQHDSWHRYAMVRELRELMKQPKASGSDHFERAGNDRMSGEIHEGLVHKAILEEKSTSQFQVPIANSEILKSSELGKVDLGLEIEEYVVRVEKIEQEGDQQDVNKKIDVVGGIERDQKMIRDAKICCAHKVFDKMPSKEKRIKHLKGWKFKFKRKSLVGIMLQIEQYKLSKRRRRMYNQLSTNIKDESMKVMIPGNHPRMLRQPHKSRVQCKVRMMNDSWSMRRPTLEIMKSHRKHKWKSKHLQIASNFWINHPPKLADLVLRAALTDWRTENSNGLAYDGCVILEMTFAGFERGKTELLATNQKMQKMDFFSFGIHTEMEENVELKQLLVAMERVSQKVIEQKIESGLICGDVKFHLKHKWRFRLLESISRLVLLAWINLWFSKAYEVSEQLQDSSKGRAESFPFLNFAVEQPLLWMQNKSEPILIFSELERKKKLCYKTWMFKYKCVKGIQRLLILLRYKSMLELEEWFKTLSRGESCWKQKKIQQFTIETEEEMEDMMEEDPKQQQGNSEPLVIVPDVDAKVELVWGSNSLIFHFKTRVWDPGRSLIKDATPREFPFHSTTTISFSLLFFFVKESLAKFSS